MEEILKKDCLISIEGGMGKNVMFTSLLPELKEKYNKVCIVSPYDDIFRSSPYVDEVYNPNNPTIPYNDFVMANTTDVFWRDPYNNQKFIKKQCHLYTAWREELGLPTKDNDAGWGKGEEKFTAFNTLDTSLRFGDLVDDVEKYVAEHPRIIVIQFQGGFSPLGYNPQDPNCQQVRDPHNEGGLRRNFYRGQKLVDMIKAEYPDHLILNYALPNEMEYAGTEKVLKPYLWWRELLKHVDKVICIDSSLQHLATGTVKDITVIWAETSPEHFGYVQNKNIKAKCSNSQAYFRPLGHAVNDIIYPTPEEIMEVVKQPVE